MDEGIDRMLARLCLVVLAACCCASPALAEQFYVRDQDEYARAAAQVEAGDVIVLAKGEWRDFDMVITGEGREDALITVRSEEAGKVLLDGSLGLGQFGGRHGYISTIATKRPRNWHGFIA